MMNTCATHRAPGRKFGLSKIRILDDSLIDKIAAGEVIERPASVVKELVENAIDAGSTRIEIEVHGGGIEYIRVSDNGCGIAEEELVLAFTRHATSKLYRENDLWELCSLGFRGEALPSIGAVARVEVTTSEGKAGAGLKVEGGIITGPWPAAAPRGTSVVVRDLFFNTPARRKFLKTPVTEVNQILDVAVRLAFSNPDISFSFSSEKRTVFKTPGDGSLLNTALAVYGRDFAQKLLPFAGSEGEIKVFGLLGRPELARRNRKGQLFYVNRRSVRNPVLSSALEEGYRGFQLAGERPVAIVFIEIPHSQVDVNVHPQKHEVRFHDEQAVFRAVMRSVREKLNSLQGGWEPGQGVLVNRATERKQIFLSEVMERPAGTEAVMMPECEPMWQEQRIAFDGGAEHVKPVNIFGQWRNSYIICEIEGKLEIIDQHAAHERLLFNEIRSKVGSIPTQELAVTVLVEVPHDTVRRLEQWQGQLEKLGFRAEPFGEKSIVIRAVPEYARNSEVETMLEILEELEEGQNGGDLMDRSCKTLACKGAVKAGQRLTEMEIKELIQRWLETENRGFCPHGRPVSVSLSEKDLERMLKR